jgi:hypothetical protein
VRKKKEDHDGWCCREYAERRDRRRQWVRCRSVKRLSMIPLAYLRPVPRCAFSDHFWWMARSTCPLSQSVTSSPPISARCASPSVGVRAI